MRNSNLLKWAHANNKQNTKNGTKNWIHSPDSLQRGHIAYLVKFLGSTEVDEPKGIEVVKEGIRKLTFNQQLKKSEGNKIPKVELTISIDGVAIQEPKTKKIMNQFPLHRISYCADDKGEKKFFSFIAKEQDSENHICFVFVSDKLAEEITLTIGQAFDLAYRRFLETSGKDLETHRHVMLLQQKLKRLEYENNVLRQRLSDLSKISGKRVIEDWLSKQGLTDLLAVDEESSVSCKTSERPSVSTITTTDFLSDTNSSVSSPSSTFPPFGNGASAPPVPPRAFESSSASKSFAEDLSLLSQPSVGTKLEGLLLDDLEDDFNPRAFEPAAKSTGNFFNGISYQLPPLSPPTKGSITPRPRPQPSNGHGNNHDLFQLNAGAHNNNNNAKINHSTDLFGMEEFNNPPPNDTHQLELENSIGLLDKRLLEMKDGFSRGLAFGNEDFSIESLDPLRN